jgi:hypothetical protein
MEFMALGSLWDVLHNELLPDIPYQLRIKMMRQAAKGMYFLHSAGTRSLARELLCFTALFTPRPLLSLGLNSLLLFEQALCTAT